MPQFDRNKAAAVARETQNAFISFDAAYPSALQLATSVLEAKHGSTSSCSSDWVRASLPAKGSSCSA